MLLIHSPALCTLAYLQVVFGVCERGTAIHLCPRPAAVYHIFDIVPAHTTTSMCVIMCVLTVHVCVCVCVCVCVSLRKQ
jgi:hypothetical protein